MKINDENRAKEKKINHDIVLKTKLLSNRVIYFDILNILAIFAVLILHHNGIVHGSPMTRAWNTSLIAECLFYFAVPLFCMLSGANLMNYRQKYNTKTFFKKRVCKVIIPFIFWALFMFVYKIFFTKTIKIGSFTELVNYFFMNKEESTYYFMFNIIGIYLTMPFVSLVAKKENMKSLWLTVALYFIFNAFIPNILALFKINYNKDASVLLGGYIIFAILGYLISITEFKKKYRYLIYISATIGVIYRYVTTFILSKKAGIVIKVTWGYTSWHSILLASAVFIAIKYIFSNKKFSLKATDILCKLSSCSFGIYLIHQLVMTFEKKVFYINTASWEWRTVFVFITYFISLLIVYIMKKIPLIKKVVP